jgi:WD40 repeat protein
MRYKAFISYSHRYLGLARALQDALYRFGTPWYERSGPKIFRDESGLAVSPDLWKILRAALDESEYFIYLASPESARSFYTQKEIEYWLSQRGPDQVILALVNGTIQWDDGASAFDAQLSDALPAVLHTAFEQTPLFVDLRAITAQNYRLSDSLFRDRVATIASALHGASKDDLYGMQVSALIMSDAERMARDAQVALAERLSDRALLLAAHALRLTESQGEPRVPEAEAALRQALARSGGRPLGSVDSRARPAYSMSDDGRWLCTVHQGDETKLWDLTAADQSVFAPVSTLRFPTPDWVQLSSDGRWLVAVAERSVGKPDTEVQLWDLCASPPTRVTLVSEGSIVQAELTQEGDYLALSTAAPGRVSVWYLPPRQENEPGATPPDSPALVVDHHFDRPAWLASSPVGTTLCGVAGDSVTVWRLASVPGDVSLQIFRDRAAVEMCRVSPAGDTLLMLVNKTPQVVRLGPDDEFERTVIDDLNDDIVHRLQISPDGRWGLLLSESGPSYVVELERPTENGFTITSEGGTMNRHAFSRNGHWLATAAGPMERFPELQVEEPEFVVRLRSLLLPGTLGEIPLASHEDLITDVTFSPDGTCVATCSVDRVIRLWDLTELNLLSGVLELLLRESDPEVLIRDFGFSEERLAEELEEALEHLQTLLVEAVSRLRAAAPQTLLGDDGAPLGCMFSGNGDWMVSTQFTAAGAGARLWDVRTDSPCAAPVRLSRSATIDNFGLNQTAALSRDGRSLFVLATGSLWRLPSDSAVAPTRLTPHGMSPVAVRNARFSPGGGMLMVYTGTDLLLLSLAPDDAVPLDTNQQPVRVAFFTEDDRWLIARCGGPTTDDPEVVRVWSLRDIGERREAFELVSASRHLRLCDTSPRSRWLLTSDDDLNVVWDLDQGDPRDSRRRLVGHRGPVADVCWGAEEQSLISAGEDGRLLRWPLTNGPEAPAPDELLAIDGPLWSVRADWPHLRIFVGAANEGGTLLTVDGQFDVIERWDMPDLAPRVRGYFSPSGRWLSTRDDRGVRVFDVERHVERLSLAGDANTIDVGNSYMYSPDERWLVVAQQYRLCLIDLSADAGVPALELPGHRHEVIDYRVTSDAHWLISIDRPINESAGYLPAQTCRIWDLWSPNPANSCVIMPDMDLGADRLELTSDGRWLITSSRDGVRAWPLGTDRLLTLAQSIIGREPNGEERRRYSFTTFESQHDEAEKQTAR